MRWAVGVMVCLALGAQPAPPSAEAPAVRKVLELFRTLEAARTAEPGAAGQGVSFTLTEAEVNEYLRYAAATNPRPGFDGTTVQLFADNYLASLTTLDFDAIEQWRPGTVPRLLQPLLRGKRQVQLDVRLRAADGMVTLGVEKATFEGVPIPAFVAEKLIAAVAARQKEQFDTTKPVKIPFGLKTVSVGAGVLRGSTR